MSGEKTMYEIQGKTIYVDIDNTICETEGQSYEDAVPIKEHIRKINFLFDIGNTIVYWTARGTMTGIDWYALTKEQLDKWGAKYDKIVMGKPAYDLFIDDKALNAIYHWTDTNVKMLLT